MNILYGVCGEGFGHSSRAIAVGEYLEKKGHKILFVSFDKGYELLKKRFKTIKIKGFYGHFDEGEINKTKTFIKTLFNFFKNFFHFKRLKKEIEEFNPDICITDMEPFSAYYSKLFNLPLISIDNPHLISNTKFEVNLDDYKDFLIAKYAIELAVPKADYYIIVSLDSPKITRKNTILISPIIKKEILSLKPREGDYVLVYLSKPHGRFINLLKKINQKFIVYGYNVNKKQGNLEFRTPERFNQDLKNCKCIISNSGFSLLSEAIYLKKPFLAIPLKGHFEQKINALVIKKKGFGDYITDFDLNSLEKFFSNLPNYKKNLLKNKLDSNKSLKTIEKIILRYENHKRKIQ